MLLFPRESETVERERAGRPFSLSRFLPFLRNKKTLRFKKTGHGRRRGPGDGHHAGEFSARALLCEKEPREGKPLFKKKKKKLTHLSFSLPQKTQKKPSKKKKTGRDPHLPLPDRLRHVQVRLGRPRRPLLPAPDARGRAHGHRRGQHRLRRGDRDGVVLHVLGAQRDPSGLRRPVLRADPDVVVRDQGAWDVLGHVEHRAQPGRIR